MRPALLLLVLAVSLGCMAKKIPGTDIDDTSDTRGVVETLNKYRAAVEKKDSNELIGLFDESFRDDGGTSSADDDLDFARLRTALPQRFERWEDIRLDMNVRKVEFDEGSANARVTYTYTVSFRMPSLSQKTQTETDIKQMTLKRVSRDGWKITSGI
jgi:hypothetical protein